MTEVVAALIWQDERFLICQRPAHKARGLLWEFVGGKVEPGETRPQALVRECREELGIEIQVGSLFQDLIHEYPDLTVHLWLYHAKIVEGEPQKLEHNDLRFISVEEIRNYPFCPADEPLLKELERACSAGEQNRVQKMGES
ncbi:MAG: (deoxy)nucleoside triphosphate pyrophosphohydrolase [Oscillospiraceae bacterium]|nr:(deoxy)nucleoside triphosphate pyrophosphohydrolase [Oscillospiraceae bacterium]